MTVVECKKPSTGESVNSRSSHGAASAISFVRSCPSELPFGLPGAAFRPANRVVIA
ncbi:hypothetical protein [Sorangium sp. So ce1182]|uniref:hypothetical protein n=1 Tax=Sorangium sp. So ce1182 TaxID=3133334 RepID=UPI003F640D39